MDHQNCLAVFYQNYNEEIRLRSKCGMVELTTIIFIQIPQHDKIQTIEL